MGLVAGHLLRVDQKLLAAEGLARQPPEGCPVSMLYVMAPRLVGRSR